MHADEDLDLEPEENDEAIEDQDWNARTLSIRRADGKEVVTIFAPDEEWNVHMQPGGGIKNAFLGAVNDPTAWVDLVDGQLERDEDGTYVIRIG
jgi:hypothetical protein